MKLEIQKIPHGNGVFSWAPIKDGKVLRNRNHPDGFCFSVESARRTLADDLKVAPGLLPPVEIRK